MKVCFDPCHEHCQRRSICSSGRGALNLNSIPPFDWCLVAVEDDEAEAANIISQVENCVLKSDDMLLKITLVVGGSSGADKVTVGAKMKGIPMMKSKSADAGAETLLMTVRLRAMMMPTRGRAWQWAGKPSWEQPDRNEKREGAIQVTGEAFSKASKIANKVLSKKPPREQPTKKGITRNLKYQKMDEKTEDVALGREKGSTEPSHAEGSSTLM